MANSLLSSYYRKLYGCLNLPYLAYIYSIKMHKNMLRGDFGTQNRVKLEKPSQVVGMVSQILRLGNGFYKEGGRAGPSQPFPTFEKLPT